MSWEIVASPTLIDLTIDGNGNSISVLEPDAVTVVTSSDLFDATITIIPPTDTEILVELAATIDISENNTEVAVNDSIGFISTIGAGVGGVLSGTLPNPGFAVDMATQAELNTEISARSSADTTLTTAISDHLADATDAHDASSISFSASGDLSSTNVQTAIAELDSEKASSGSVTTVSNNLAAHLIDTIDAHDASAVSVIPAGDIASTDVQSALVELDTEKASATLVSGIASNLAAHVADISDAHDASAISVTPAGGLAATDVQAALEELDAEMASAGDIQDVADDLAAHLADATAAHAASAVSNVPAGNIAAITVQAALNELDTDKATTGSVAAVAADLATHLADPTDVHAATAITNQPAGTLTSQTAQAAINELDTKKATTGSVTTVASNLSTHIGLATDAHDASAISLIPTGDVGAVNLQAGIAELASIKVNILRTIVPGEGLAGGGDLSANRELAIDWNNVTTGSDVTDDDLFTIYDASAGGHRTITKSAIIAGITENYSAENKHGSTIGEGCAVATHSSGTGIVKAIATGLAKPCVGFMVAATLNTVAGDVQTDGIFTMEDWTAVAGTATLTRGIYYLDNEAGKITATATDIDGQIVQVVGYAISPTDLDISITPPIKL